MDVLSKHISNKFCCLLNTYYYEQEEKFKLSVKLLQCFMEPMKKIQVEGHLMFTEPQELYGNLDELCYVSAAENYEITLQSFVLFTLFIISASGGNVFRAHLLPRVGGSPTMN